MGRPNKSRTPAKQGKTGRKMQNFARLSTGTKPKSKGQEGNSKARHGFQKQGGQPKKQRRWQQQQQQRRPVMIPFQPSDRILLVGEGDFSFSASLVSQHGCHNLLATCYDKEDTLNEKYLQAKKHINQLLTNRTLSISGRGGMKRKRDDEEGDDAAETSTGHDVHATATATTNGNQDGADTSSEPQLPKVLYSIDARKLGASSPGGGGKLVRKGFPRQSPPSSTKRARNNNHSTATNSRNNAPPDGGPWDIICFNFPHVGGLSTDVNRQVRANQELLVSFFKACVPLLSTPPQETDDTTLDDDEEEADYDDPASGTQDESDSETQRDNKARYKLRTEPGQIVVTLFEGEPYTLWNIRDLARHAGLRVVTSFKFPWESYAGYSHARTLGEIESKDGGRGGWRGEERAARSYVFERKDHADLAPKTNRKRARDSDDSDGD